MMRQDQKRLLAINVLLPALTTPLPISPLNTLPNKVTLKGSNNRPKFCLFVFLLHFQLF